jgi:hypothetical protein
MPARSLSAQKIRNIITLNVHSRSSYRELSRLFDVASSTAGNPTSPGVGLALGQHRNSCVVAMQPLGCKSVRFDALEDRLEHSAARSDLVPPGSLTNGGRLSR